MLQLKSLQASERCTYSKIELDSRSHSIGLKIVQLDQRSRST